MRWIQISIAIERVVVDKATTLFGQYEKNGFTEEDFNDDHSIVWLSFFVEVEKEHEYLRDDALLCKKDIQSTLDDAEIDLKAPIRAEILDMDNWLTGFKTYTEEVKMLPGLVIAPIWNGYEAKEDERVYYYDTNLSFGTGEHETTYSCSQLVSLYGKKSQKILDIGTGTGILLLVAHFVNPTAQLFGIDIDADAVKQAKLNCEFNKVDAEIIEGDLAVKYNDKADLILANLTVDPLKFLLPIIESKLTDDGHLIISGIVDDRREEIKPYIDKTWQIVEHIQKRNWNTYVLKKR